MVILYRKWKGLKRWIKIHQENEETQDKDIRELKNILLEFFEKQDYKYYAKKLKREMKK